MSWVVLAAESFVLPARGFSEITLVIARTEEKLLGVIVRELYDGEVVVSRHGYAFPDGFEVTPMMRFSASVAHIEKSNFHLDLLRLFAHPDPSKPQDVVVLVQQHRGVSESVEEIVLEQGARTRVTSSAQFLRAWNGEEVGARDWARSSLTIDPRYLTNHQLPHASLHPAVVVRENKFDKSVQVMFSSVRPVLFDKRDGGRTHEKSLVFSSEHRKISFIHPEWITLPTVLSSDRTVVLSVERVQCFFDTVFTWHRDVTSGDMYLHVIKSTGLWIRTKIPKSELGMFSRTMLRLPDNSFAFVTSQQTRGEDLTYFLKYPARALRTQRRFMAQLPEATGSHVLATLPSLLGLVDLLLPSSQPRAFAKSVTAQYIAIARKRWFLCKIIESDPFRAWYDFAHHGHENIRGRIEKQFVSMATMALSVGYDGSDPLLPIISRQFNVPLVMRSVAGIPMTVLETMPLEFVQVMHAVYGGYVSDLRADGISQWFNAYAQEKPTGHEEVNDFHYLLRRDDGSKVDDDVSVQCLSQVFRGMDRLPLQVYQIGVDTWTPITIVSEVLRLAAFWAVGGVEDRRSEMHIPQALKATLSDYGHGENLKNVSERVVVFHSTRMLRDYYRSPQTVVLVDATSKDGVHLYAGARDIRFVDLRKVLITAIAACQRFGRGDYVNHDRQLIKGSRGLPFFKAAFEVYVHIGLLFAGPSGSEWFKTKVLTHRMMNSPTVRIESNDVFVLGYDNPWYEETESDEETESSKGTQSDEETVVSKSVKSSEETESDEEMESGEEVVVSKSLKIEEEDDDDDDNDDDDAKREIGSDEEDDDEEPPQAGHQQMVMDRAVSMTAEEAVRYFTSPPSHGSSIDKEVATLRLELEVGEGRMTAGDVRVIMSGDVRVVMSKESQTHEDVPMKLRKSSEMRVSREARAASALVSERVTLAASPGFRRHPHSFVYDILVEQLALAGVRHETPRHLFHGVEMIDLDRGPTAVNGMLTNLFGELRRIEHPAYVKSDMIHGEFFAYGDAGGAVVSKLSSVSRPGVFMLAHALAIALAAPYKGDIRSISFVQQFVDLLLFKAFHEVSTVRDLMRGHSVACRVVAWAELERTRDFEEHTTAHELRPQQSRKFVSGLVKLSFDDEFNILDWVKSIAGGVFADKVSYLGELIVSAVQAIAIDEQYQFGPPDSKSIVAHLFLPVDGVETISFGGIENMWDDASLRKKFEILAMSSLVRVVGGAYERLASQLGLSYSMADFVGLLTFVDRTGATYARALHDLASFSLFHDRPVPTKAGVDLLQLPPHSLVSGMSVPTATTSLAGCGAVTLFIRAISLAMKQNKPTEYYFLNMIQPMRFKRSWRVMDESTNISRLMHWLVVGDVILYQMGNAESPDLSHLSELKQRDTEDDAARNAYARTHVMFQAMSDARVSTHKLAGVVQSTPMSPKDAIAELTTLVQSADHMFSERGDFVAFVNSLPSAEVVLHHLGMSPQKHEAVTEAVRVLSKRFVHTRVPVEYVRQVGQHINHVLDIEYHLRDVPRPLDVVVLHESRHVGAHVRVSRANSPSAVAYLFDAYSRIFAFALTAIFFEQAIEKGEAGVMTLFNKHFFY